MSGEKDKEKMALEAELDEQGDDERLPEYTPFDDSAAAGTASSSNTMERSGAAASTPAGTGDGVAAAETVGSSATARSASSQTAATTTASASRSGTLNTAASAPAVSSTSKSATSLTAVGAAATPPGVLAIEGEGVDVENPKKPKTKWTKKRKTIFIIAILTCFCLLAIVILLAVLLTVLHPSSVVAPSPPPTNPTPTIVISALTPTPTPTATVSSGPTYAPPGSVPLVSFNISLTYQIYAVAHGQLGSSMDGGDFDGDNYDDIYAGAPAISQVVLLYGRPNISTSTPIVDLKYPDKVVGSFATFVGAYVGDGFGTAVAGRVDIDKDGKQELIVGAPTSASAYVIYGSAQRPSETTSVNVSTTAGIVSFVGPAGSQFGASVGTGDFNNDGFVDYLIGAPAGSAAGAAQSGTGMVYLIFGVDPTGTQLPNPLQLATTGVAQQYTIFAGEASDDSFGNSLSPVAADINGDGVDDIVLTAKNANGQTGRVYVYFGQTNPATSWPLLVDYGAGAVGSSVGFSFSGNSSDLAGSSVSMLGDYNGDGHKDLLIGAPGYIDFVYDPTKFQNEPVYYGRGAVYVIFGRPSSVTTAFPTSSAQFVGSNGFAIYAASNEDSFGNSVSTAGDQNRDGVDDILIGAPSAQVLSKTFAGKVSVVYGHKGAFIPVVDLAVLHAPELGFYYGFSDFNSQTHFGTAVTGGLRFESTNHTVYLAGAPNSSPSFVDPTCPTPAPPQPNTCLRDVRNNAGALRIQIDEST